MEKHISEVVTRINSCQDINEYLNDMAKQKKTLNSKEKKALYRYIDNFSKNDGSKVVAAWLILYSYNELNDLSYLRRRGVFRYAVKWKDTIWCIEKFIELGIFFNLNQDEINYLNGKKENKWLSHYYFNTEKALCRHIDDRYKYRQRKRVGLYVFESSLTLELMVFIEMLYRFIYGGEKISNPADKDRILGYSIEDLMEGISYLLHLCYERIPVPKDRTLWINPSYVLSDDIEKMVVEAAKYKTIEEIEYQSDCLGCKYLRDNNGMIISDDKGFDKCLRTGYVKYELQREAKSYSILQKENTGMSLKEIADLFYENAKDFVFKKVDEGTPMERYRMELPDTLLDKLALSTKDGIPELYKEEMLDTCINAGELFLTNSEMLNMYITKDCTVADLVVFKRFFYITSELKNMFFSGINDTKTIARSLIPVASVQSLEINLSRVLKSQAKASQLLELFTYTGKGKLDILYTPIIKLSESKCYIMTEVLTRSNLIPNAIVHSRHMGDQTTNSDGNNNPLENYTNHIFENSKYGFNCSKGLKFKYKGQAGEIDNVIWTDSNIYLIECKNNMNPTSVYELRTTLDYIVKACSQLELSEEAFKDGEFRKKYFAGWKIKYNNQRIVPFIVLGNRVFCSQNIFKYPVRHVYELEEILDSGIVNGTLGQWRIWESDCFSEKELLKFLSDQDVLGNAFSDAMFPIEWNCTCNGKLVKYKTYACNHLMLASAFDDNLTIIDRKDAEREKALADYGMGAQNFEEYKDILIKELGGYNE